MTKHRVRTIGVGVILLAVVGFFLARPILGPVSAQDPDERQRLYSDPVAFECLSSSAQNLLESLFGKQQSSSDASPTSDGLTSTSDGLTSQAARHAHDGQSHEAVAEILAARSDQSQPLFSALSNSLVNDPFADLTNRDTQSETTLVLGTGSNVIAGFNDSGSFLPGSNKFTGFSRSVNGGANWTDGGTLPTNPTGDAGDPVLARDNVLGRTYFSTLSFSGPGLQVFRSDTDAATWVAPVNAAPGVPGFQDKEWMTVDNFAGPGQGNVYVAWRSFTSPPLSGIRFTRSTDNGATYGPSGGTLIAGGGAFNVQGAWVTVGADHAVYVFWLDQSAGFGTPNIIKVRKSTDLGLTFAPAVNVATLTTTGINGSLGAVGGFRTNSFPQVVVNPANASHLMIVYNDNPPGADSGDIFFRQSTDGGATWGAAVKLNTDLTTTLQFFPAIAVTPTGTHVAVTWNDRRQDPADQLIARWGVIGTLVGTTVTFGPNFRISAQFPAVFGVDPVLNPAYMSDYEQVVADSASFYHTWSDNRDNSTFPGAGRKNANVRFARIPLTGPGPIPDFESSAVSGGDGDGIIEPNECNKLNITVRNNGTAAATGILGVLSTSTPGVTVTQSISDYPNLAAGAAGTNAIPFQISVSAGLVCGTTINLTLTLTYAGGTDTSNFTLPTCAQCPPVTVSGSIGTGDPFSLGRLFRDDPPSSCAASQSCAIFNPAGQYRYDTHAFTNGTIASCVDVRVTTPCTGSNFIQAAGFLGSFNPASLCQNFLGDIGASPTANTPKSFSFNVAPNANFTVVVNESFIGFGCSSYSAEVSGIICPTRGNGVCAPVTGCTRTQGYWKTHSSNWPVGFLTLGTVSYNQAQLLSILNQPVNGNGLVALAHQLIGARLNIANGASAPASVLAAIANANSLIDGLIIPPVGGGWLAPSSTSTLIEILDQYNQGLASGGPGHCQ